MKTRSDGGAQWATRELTVGLDLLLSGEESLNVRKKTWHAILPDVPDDFRIDIVVFVPEDISHGPNARPIVVGKLLFSERAELRGCFGNAQQASFTASRTRLYSLNRAKSNPSMYLSISRTFATMSRSRTNSLLEGNGSVPFYLAPQSCVLNWFGDDIDASAGHMLDRRLQSLQCSEIAEAGSPHRFGQLDDDVDVGPSLFLGACKGPEQRNVLHARTLQSRAIFP